MIRVVKGWLRCWWEDVRDKRREEAARRLPELGLRIHGGTGCSS